MRGSLLVAGTHSDAGKSVVVAGICRWLAREGVRVAPFKAQNMALNSYVTREGAEIGRAQASQATAAMIEPEAAMNPILLKPSAEKTTQVVVRGKAWTTASATSYGEMKRGLMPVVLESLEDMRRRFDVVVCEGAGSPAEINLRENDLANMGLARAASLPVLLVGDIDRGGLFASLYGTLALLSAEDQSLVAGFLVNKFRGDPAVLAPGLEQMTALTGRPFFGTLPWISGLGLDGEDSLALDAPRPVKPPPGRDTLCVAVARLGRISNFTDFDALAHEPGVSVRFTLSAEEILDADLAVIPGTKATVEDLRLLRSRSLDSAFAERARRGLPTLGICGGYQMLGGRIEDGVESGEASAVGLGLLPLETCFERDKILGRPEGWATSFGGAEVSGYEIHHGRVSQRGGEPLFTAGDGVEGCRIGSTLGTSWHGILESDGFRRSLLAWVAAERDLDWTPGDGPFAAAREAQLEKLGDLVADNVDREALLRLIDEGQPLGLPFVRLQATGYRHQQGDSNGAYVAGTSRPAGAELSLTGVAEPKGSPAEAQNLTPETCNLKPYPMPDAFETTKLLFVTTADTEILAAAKASERLPEGFPDIRCANPVALGDPAPFFDRELDGARAVLVRLLGGRRAWPEGLEELRRRCARLGIPLLAFGGEAEPDAELAALSTVPSGTVLEAFEYLRHGGVGNTENLLRFVADTVLMEGYGFEPASPLPEVGVYHPLSQEDAPVDELLARHDPGRPTVGVIFYRAHWMSGNTAFVDDLVGALEEAGTNALPVYCYSLRAGADGRVTALELLKDRVDCLITTVLAGGGSNAADAHRSGSPEEWLEWEVPALEELGIPVIQGICTTSTREAWLDSAAGLSPLDTAWQVAIPEFDGRIVGVPFSFKERLGDGSPVGAPLTLYRADTERTARLAGLAARFAALGGLPNQEKKVAILLSNYPTKHSRVGNAVGLDTPVSAIELLGALREAGYSVGDTLGSGDDLIHSLIAAGGHDLEFLTTDQLGGAAGRLSTEIYAAWFARLPEGLRNEVEEHWGPPPGELYVHGRDFVVAGLQFGNVFVGIQPPRGFGENPIAIYHDPDLPPTHHYLAAYWWMIEEFGADAVVHLGKHGTLEWLPGKSLGLSPSCAPDAALRDVPLFYPFVVNDPGEGTQAKRRAHATVVDHLIPPMTRAETYDDLAKLEQLLDEYYQVETLDPSKLPAIRVRIWETLRDAELHSDLGVEEQPEEFSDFLTHVDGYLCEIKDLPIRGGLHVLGQTPQGEPLRHLVAQILRLGAGEVPGLREAVGYAFDLDERSMAESGGARVEAPPALAERFPGTVATASDLLDLLEEAQQALLLALEARNWDAEAAGTVCEEVIGIDDAGVIRALRFAADEVVPRLMRTPEEMGNLISGLGGGYVPAGPSGSPTRGLVNVLPTGRNFYSVDPKALPSRLSWEVGQGLADDLLRRYLEEEGRYPESVGIVVWGTAAMRTQGDDVAEILALLGVRPVWNEESRRVTGLEVVPLRELGRPRIDVTVRISGFFRDAFPNLISLLDDAFTTVAALHEPDDRNFIRKHTGEERREGAGERRSTTRIFGSKPGAYGAGLLPLMDARNWRTDEDLAEVYAVWGGYAYGRGLDGVEAREAMESNLRRTEIAVKNIDNREHDLFDSDDYFQYHGGMIAAVRALTGRDPKAYIGDSADPSRVMTRDLSEETRRVFRSRVANPKWIGAMQRHGYKGAFELSATVDYLFGYDATAGVVEDWMYRDVTRKYVLDEEVREFMRESNPWALRAISERLLEAAQRGLWSEPDERDLEALKQVYIENEGMLEEKA